MNNHRVTLALATERELSHLKNKINKAFSVAAKEQFDESKPNHGPSAEELERAYHTTDSRVYCIFKDETMVGGAVLTINEETWHNKMDLFFIFKECQNQGLGLDAWKAIEKEYPQTAVWELDTPYVEKRNIHFYVNKCGFHIVEYYNKWHPNSHKPFPVDEIEDDGFFRFEKKYKRHG